MVDGSRADARWPDHGPLSSLSPRRRWYVLAMAAVTTLLVGATLVAVLDELRPPDRAQPDVPGTVVLVPGFGGDTSTLQLLALRLRVADRRTVVVEPPGPGLGDFSGQAAAIDAAVAAALRRGAPSVDVVAFSAGGVATWLWLAEGRSAPAARRVVTLGSPLQGAELAAAGSVLAPGTCTPACRQLAPGSALLTRLAAYGPPRDVPWVSVLEPHRRGRPRRPRPGLPGVRDIALQDVCTDAAPTHSGLPIDFVTIGLLLYAIDRRPMPALGTGDCASIRALGTGRPRLALN